MLFSSYIGLRPHPQGYIYPPIINKPQEIIEELYTVRRIRPIINIQNFIKLLSKKVEDLIEDLIKYIAELYIGPNCNVKINKEVIKKL